MISAVGSRWTGVRRLAVLALAAVAISGVLTVVTSTERTGAAATVPSTITTCRGLHVVEGYVVTSHVVVPTCPSPGFYYSYNANRLELPRDGMLTCNGSNNHGDPPAPYVIVRTGIGGNCSSYGGEKITAYWIRLPRSGLVVCDVQRDLPAGWVASSRHFEMSCKGPYDNGIMDNASIIVPG